MTYLELFHLLCSFTDEQLLQTVTIVEPCDDPEYLPVQSLIASKDSDVVEDGQIILTT